MFLDRELELNHLERSYASEKAELVVIYGRRRVGKTELLRAFCEDKPHIFFIATLSSDGEQLQSFSEKVYAFNHSEVSPGFSYPTWEAAFRALTDLPQEQRPVIVLDEFTYLISGNKALTSILQKVWDERVKETKIMLILCGSYIGMMEQEVLSVHAPLYGRRTVSLFLRPLDLRTSCLFFPEYGPEDQFFTWAILGGMPYYLQIFKQTSHPDGGLFDQIKTHLLDARTGILYNEPRLLLMEELREPRNYFSILRAIAQGKTRLNQIWQSSGLTEVTAVNRYLDILQQLRLVTRKVPITEERPEKSRKGIYQIDDHFLKFWFRYIHPYQSSLDLGLLDAVFERHIKPDLIHFAATAFEEAAKDFLAMKARQNELPFIPERIGSWWDQSSEIDVVALSTAENAALIGECKWSIHPVGLNVLLDLREKAKTFSKLAHIENLHYCLFSKSGFTPELQEQALRDGIRLFSLADMLS